MPDYLRTCQEAAAAGGAVLLDWTGRFSVREKGPADLVTEADVASQEAIRQIISARFPSHQFISEEDHRDNAPGTGYRWIVDPLDGTMNYVHHVPHYAVSVALALGDEVVAGAVYEPNSRECYSAAKGEGAYLSGRRMKTSGVERLSEALAVASFAAKIDRHSPEIAQFVEAVLACQGVRRTGSAALNLCYVAAGRFDAFWAGNTYAWDVAAGVLLVTEAGGTVTDFSGGPFHLSVPHPVATASRPLAEQFCRLLQAAEPA